MDLLHAPDQRPPAAPTFEAAGGLDYDGRLANVVPTEHLVAVQVDTKVRVISVLLVLDDKLCDRSVGVVVKSLTNANPGTRVVALGLKRVHNLCLTPSQGNRVLGSRDCLAQKATQTPHQGVA
jgi:hypothetical protein